VCLAWPYSSSLLSTEFDRTADENRGIKFLSSTPNLSVFETTYESVSGNPDIRYSFVD